ncbi:MAG: enoyl-CoA hydratase [Actinomycetota bacterium]|jgi:enoyl-CoA hydratase|nr:enoyl-CoA hydratase [Actinomycetota bacterium]
MDFTTLLVLDDRPDRVSIQLHRPEVKNAINRTMATELHEVCAELERSPRILILSGSGGDFASGADISEMLDRTRDDALRGINSRVFVRIAALAMPVIAAIDGWAMGGGAELAYAADFRIASSGARFGNPEVSLGIIAAAGASWRLAELVGEPLAKEMLMAGRIVGADEALAARLVTEVHPAAELLDAANALADRIAKQDPLAVQLTKKVFHAPLSAHPEVDEVAQATLFESPEKRSRMSAFLERRAK